MVKSANTQRSERCELTLLGVQVPPPTQFYLKEFSVDGYEHERQKRNPLGFQLFQERRDKRAQISPKTLTTEDFSLLGVHF